MRSLPGDLLALANLPRGRSSSTGSTDQITLALAFSCLAAVPTRQRNTRKRSSKNQQKIAGKRREQAMRESYLFLLLVGGWGLGPIKGGKSVLFSLAWGLSLSQEEVGGRGRRAAEAFTFSSRCSFLMCQVFFPYYFIFLQSWLLQGFFNWIFLEDYALTIFLLSRGD